RGHGGQNGGRELPWDDPTAPSRRAPGRQLPGNGPDEVRAAGATVECGRRGNRAQPVLGWPPRPDSKVEPFRGTGLGRIAAFGTRPTVPVSRSPLMATSMLSARAPSPAPEGAARAPRIEVSVRVALGEVVVLLAGEATVGLAGELARVLLGLTACRPPLVTPALGGLKSVSCLAPGVLAGFPPGGVRARGRMGPAAPPPEPRR